MGDYDLAVDTSGNVYANAGCKKQTLMLLPFGSVSLIPAETVGKTSCVFKKSSGHFIPFFGSRKLGKIMKAICRSTL